MRNKRKGIIKIKYQRSKIKYQRSKIKDQRSKIKYQRSNINDQRSKIKDQRSKIKDQISKIKYQRSKIKDQRSKIKYHRSNNTPSGCQMHQLNLPHFIKSKYPDFSCNLSSLIYKPVVVDEHLKIFLRF